MVSRETKYLKNGIPMIWREPKDHINGCYFYKVNVKGSAGKTHSTSSFWFWIQFCFQFHTQMKFHCVSLQGLLIFMTNSSWISTADNEEGERSNAMEFRPTDTLFKTLILFNQIELNNLVRDLHFPKPYAELLASRLNEQNLLIHGTSVTYYLVENLHFSNAV